MTSLVFSIGERDAHANPNATFQSKAQGRPGDVFWVGSPNSKRDACRFMLAGKMRYGYVIGGSCAVTNQVSNGTHVPPKLASQVSPAFSSGFEYVRPPSAPHSFVTLHSSEIEIQLPALAVGDTLCVISTGGTQYYGTVEERFMWGDMSTSRTRCAAVVDNKTFVTDSFQFYYPVINAPFATINVPVGRGEETNGFYFKNAPPEAFARIAETPCIITWGNLKLTGAIRPFFNSSYTAGNCMVGAFGQVKNFDEFKIIDTPKNGAAVSRDYGPTVNHPAPATISSGGGRGWQALWVGASINRTPEGAVTPISNGGKPNYICRKMISGQNRVGRTWHGTCFIGVNGAGGGEQGFTSGYEIAVGDP